MSALTVAIAGSTGDVRIPRKVASISRGNAYSASSMEELKSVYATLQDQIGDETAAHTRMTSRFRCVDTEAISLAGERRSLEPER